MAYTYKKLLQSQITDDEFEMVCSVENSSDEGYGEDIMQEIWVKGNKNDNFVCFDDDKIVAHISFNPFSKRRNGSIFMVNLTVLPEYRKRGIAQNLILEACKYYLNNKESLPMSTSVDKTNIPAVNLYKKVGFCIKEPVCELDEDDEQYIMEATLIDIKQKIESFLVAYSV